MVNFDKCSVLFYFVKYPACWSVVSDLSVHCMLRPEYLGQYDSQGSCVKTKLLIRQLRNIQAGSWSSVLACSLNPFPSGTELVFETHLVKNEKKVKPQSDKVSCCASHFPDSILADAQACLGLRCPHMSRRQLLTRLPQSLFVLNPCPAE